MCYEFHLGKRDNFPNLYIWDLNYFSWFTPPYVRIVVAFFISDNWGGLDKTMPPYTIERKDAVLVKLLPPYNRSISEVAQSEGITEATLYNWLKKAKKEGHLVPERGKASPESCDGQTKFTVVFETAAMNASESSFYCVLKANNQLHHLGHAKAPQAKRVPVTHIATSNIKPDRRPDGI
ncbi:MAG TPA: transposase [Thiotrichales bacterium]|nr:transposase [Thiotrichales bacterium]